MKNFICINDCSVDELNELVDLGSELKQQIKAGTLKKTLDGKVLSIIFEKASLRTRVSFEVATINLGGSAIYLKPEDIGILGEREPIKDIARVLSRYSQGIIARTFSHDSIIELAEYADVPVINALSDYSHPCEAMSDVLTIKEHLGKLEGVKIAYIGDGNNVARSLAFAAAKFDMKLAIASPTGYELDADSIAKANKTKPDSVTQLNDPAQAIKDCDVIYTDTWVSMGQESQTEKRIKDFEGFQVNSELLSLSPKAKIMHCLPAHRGQEITDEVAESANSIIFDQSENRLHFQRALLHKLLT